MIHIDPVLAGQMRLGAIQAREVTVSATPGARFAVLEALARDYTERFRGIPPGKIPGVRAVRNLFYHTGLDPTRYRPSSEALLRRAVRDKPLYSINSAVDRSTTILCSS